MNLLPKSCRSRHSARSNGIGKSVLRQSKLARAIRERNLDLSARECFAHRCGSARFLWYTITAVLFTLALVSELVTPPTFAHSSLYVLSIFTASFSRERQAVHAATFGGFIGTALCLFRNSALSNSAWITADGLVSILLVLAAGGLTSFLMLERARGRQRDTFLTEADRALLKNERRLENAERIGDSGSWEVDIGTGTVVLSRNLQCLLLFGAGTRCQSARELLRFVHHEDRSRVLESARLALIGGASIDLVHRIVRIDGAERHVRTIADILPERDGLLFSGVVRDVTDRLLAEERANESDALKRFAGQIARLGGWRYDIRDDQLVRTPEAAMIRGSLPGHAPTLEEASEGFRGESCREIRAAMRACLEDGEAFDLVLMSRDEAAPWVRILGEPVRDGSGDIVGAQGALQDVTELVSAREQTDEANARLARALDQMTEAFFVLDREWKYIYLNRRVTEILRRSEEELLGKVIWEVFPEARGTTFDEKFREAAESGKPVQFVAYYPPMAAWFGIDAEPTPDGLAVFFKDVTRQRADEEQLRLLSEATARLNDMILITEGDVEDPTAGAKIVYANEAFERQTGYTTNDILGRTLSLLHGEQTDVEELRMIGESLAAGQQVHSELTYHRKSGEAFRAEVDIVPIRDGEPITHWVVVGRDVSERARFLEELQLSEERFRLVSRATNDIIYDWDVDQSEIWWSETAERLLGMQPTAAATELPDFLDRIHPEDQDRMRAALHSVLDGSTTVLNAEYRLPHPERGYLTIVEKAFALRKEGRKPHRIVGSLQDVTEARAQQAQLQQAQKLEVTGQLTGGIAHDFNNLLTIIIGNTELIEDYAENNPQLQELAQTTISVAERGAELTHHLLAFARRQPLEPELVDVGALFEDMRPLFLRALTEVIDLNIEVGAELCPVNVDKHQLENALLNLVINARDAMPTGGHLSIKAANQVLNGDYVSGRVEVSAGEYVMIALSDDGEGMSTDVQQKVFEPFFTTKEVGKGSGMGLSMVYGFVKQSNGHIAIYSEPGEGTVVRLYLPRAAGAAALAPQDDGQIETTGKAEHILVVEDDDQLRENVANQLSSLGYRLTLSANGPEALEALATSKDISLMFTDIVMPGGMNGREVVERARQMYPELKVIYTSGYTQDASVHQGRMEVGARFLSKPYRRRDLSRIIKETLKE